MRWKPTHFITWRSPLLRPVSLVFSTDLFFFYLTICRNQSMLLTEIQIQVMKDKGINIQLCIWEYSESHAQHRSHAPAVNPLFDQWDKVCGKTFNVSWSFVQSEWHSWCPCWVSVFTFPVLSEWLHGKVKGGTQEVWLLPTNPKGKVAQLNLIRPCKPNSFKSVYLLKQS